MKQLICTADVLIIRQTPGGTDTRRRILEGERVLAYGESYDGKWAYVTAPAGAGWASLEYLKPATPIAPKAPGGLAIIPRAKWGARHGQGNASPGAKALVVVHHFASPDVPANAAPMTEEKAIQGVEKHHVETNKWQGIGYNFVIAPSGRIYEGRGWGRVGAHAPGANSKSVGVAFAIDGDKHALTEAAKNAFRWLMAEGIKRGSIARDFTVKGHRDFGGGTRCPGDKVYAELGELA